MKRVNPRNTPLRCSLVYLYPLVVRIPSVWTLFSFAQDSHGNTFIVVFVDRLSKMDHLAVVSDPIDGKGTAIMFIDCAFRQHRLPVTIISNRDPRFTGQFWTSILEVLDTKLKMSTTRIYRRLMVKLRALITSLEILFAVFC